MVKKIIDFIKHDIWQTADTGKGKWSWLIRPFKIVLYTIKGIGEHDIFIRSTSLTYYTIMSMVPVAALIFGIMKGFGFDANLQEWLYSKFADYSVVIDYLMVFVDNMLARTRGGVIAAVGIAVLLWAVIKVFANIEKAFNSIWEVRRPRSMTRKFTDYIAIVFIAPILLITAISLEVYVRNLLSWVAWDWVLDVLFGLATLVILWALFVFIYWMMPNTKVKFKGAVIAAIIAGTAFYIFQKLYFLIQGSVSSYNAVYGTFAAIPLFLVWISTSWQILLIGAELSFAYQNIERYEFESRSSLMNIDNKRKILLATMMVVVRHFMNNEGPVDSTRIADELNIPVRSVRDVIYELEKAGFVVAVEHDGTRVNYYVPARDVHNITIYDIINAIEREGNSTIDYEALPELEKVGKLLDQIKEKAFDSEFNVSLSELLK